jgi:HlyD family secretion protein
MTEENQVPTEDEITPAITEKPNPKPLRAGIILLIVIVILAILAAIGLIWAKKPMPRQIQGSVDADEVNVGTKTLSRIEKLMVAEGQMVQEGQLLATLSNPEINSMQKQADAALQTALANESLALNGNRPEDIASVYAAWKAAESAAELARKSSVRADNLLRDGVIAQQRADEAHAARDSAAMNAEALKQQYIKAKAGTRSETKSIADAQVKIAQASKETATSFNKETMLYAPIAGEISHRLAMPGEIVAPAVPVFQIIDINHLKIIINIKEDDYKGIQKDKIIHGDIPALGIKYSPFKITYISPQGDFATWRATRQNSGYDIRTFEIHLEPVQKINNLRPGMSVLFNWPQ